MSSIKLDQELSLKNYRMLNTIIPKYLIKKFPYNIIQSASESGLALTHKNIELSYIKDKNYFVESHNSSKYKKGGIYGGSSEKIKIYFM